MRLTNHIKGDGLKARLLRGGLGSVVVKFSGIGLSLLMAVALARSLGAEGYGTYVYVYALISLLAVPARFGLPTLVVRETAKADAEQDWGLMAGIWRWAGFVACGLSLALAIISAGLAWLFSEQFSTLQLLTFGWGLVFIPLLALASLRGAALRGLRKVVQGQLPEQVIRPVLLILFLLMFLLFSKGTVSADQAMAMHALAAGIAFAIGAWMLARQRPQPLREHPKPYYESKAWLKAVIPFALTSGTNIIDKRADIILLGLLGTVQDVGVFQVVTRGASVVLLAQVAIRQMAAPYFARFYRQSDFEKLQRLAVISVRAAALIALPTVIVFALFGRELLSGIFGEEYISGFAALMILSVAQLVWAATGTLGVLLNMTGHERDNLKIGVMGLVCNVLLNCIMIPLWGLEGAALATGTTIVLKRIVFWCFVRYRLGLDGSIIGLSIKAKEIAE